MNVITGLPRAGSTVMCNILAQNPAYKIHHTSPLAAFVNNISLTASVSPDMQNAYVDDQSMYKRMVDSTRAFTDEWNKFTPKPARKKRVAGGAVKKVVSQTVWDKSRLWGTNIMPLRELYPEAKVIVMVRDLRDVAASLEKQHRKQPFFDQTAEAQNKTMWDRTEQMMMENSLIGSSVKGVEDIMRRDFPNVIVIAYEELVYNPAKILAEIDDFEYDFENIVNTATDVDAMNYDKFPHKGEGKINKEHVNEWKEMFKKAPDLANEIHIKYPFYTKQLGY